MRTSRWLIAFTGLVACALVQAAGSVQVNFDKPNEFADIGRSQWDQERNVQLLREQFQGYAGRLPDGQSLKVDVLDVDLAGTMKPFHGSQDVRVLNGRVDWPRIQLRWALSAGDRVLKSGEEQLSDLSYLQSGIGIDRSRPLAYESRLLDRWFSERVAAGAAGTR